MSLLSCGNPAGNNNQSLSQINSFIIDSVYLPLSEADHQKLKIKEIKDDRRELIAFVRERNFKIYIYDLKNNYYIDSIDVSKYRKGYVDFAPMNADSFVISLSSNKIILVSKEKTKEWNVKFIKERLGKYVCIGYNSAEPLHVFNDTIMITTASLEPFQDLDKRPNFQFLNAFNDVLFRLRKDSVEFIKMHNPNPEYLREQDYNTASERAYIDNNRIINSFKHSDTISIFNFRTGTTIWAKYKTQNFFKNKPFDYSKISDFGYIKAYAMEQSRSGMGDLYHDRFRHRIYQTLHHKGQYIDSITGEKNKTEDIPSSIFVFDENLNQLKEVYVPGKTFTYSQFSFITKSGFYYAKAFSKQKYHDKMLFYRIVFN